jgi:adenylate cyclase
MLEEQRKLSAIMFTDIVGYSALSEKNEALSLELLEEHRQILRSIFPKYNAREIKTIGDAFHIEFSSAIEAVNCAIEIQKTITKRNLSVPPEKNIQIRIGINVGDVVYKDGDTFGDGVNIAARIEPLAEPGGVCISERVYDDIRSKPEIKTLFLGEKNLKNISHPIKLYAITSEGLPAPQITTSTSGKTQIEKDSIAVLPFKNMSDSKENEYFSDGMTESIITDLAKLQGLLVIARNSVFQYKDKSVDIKQVGKELNVRYVLEGSVQRFGDALRINVQLIDASNSYHLWADRFDRKATDLFSVQDEISKNIVAALKLKLTSGEEQQLSKRPTKNIEAYDFYLRGLYHFNKQTRTDNDIAINMFEKAVNIDPEFALAYAELGKAYSEKFFTFAPQKEWEEKAFVSVEKALSIDQNLAEAYAAKARTIWTPSNNFPHERAIAEYKHALSIKPNLSDAHSELGLIYMHIGLFDRALEELEKAIEINPTYTDSQLRLGMAHLWRCEYEEAYKIFKKIPREFDTEFLGYCIFTALFNLSKKDEAFYVLEEVEKNFPKGPLLQSTQAIFFSDEGKLNESEEKIKNSLEIGKGLGHFHHITYNVAGAYSIMGKNELSLKFLKKTAEDGFPCYPLFEKDSNLNNLREDKQFIEFMEKLKEQWEYFKENF